MNPHSLRVGPAKKKMAEKNAHHQTYPPHDSKKLEIGISLKYSTWKVHGTVPTYWFVLTLY